MDISLTVRDLRPEDLAELDWTGEPYHLEALATDLVGAADGTVVQLVLALPNGRLVGFGAANLESGVGTLKQLSVHEQLQGLGLGSQLIRALEERIHASGRSDAEIAAEHDNPRAAALYRRLGYVEDRAALESWSVGPGQTYVTVITVFRRRLA